MYKVHYNVSGILNSNMKTQLKNALDKVEGIQGVNVDLTRSTVEVSYSENANESEIRDCIEHVGCKIDQ